MFGQVLEEFFSTYFHQDWHEDYDDDINGPIAYYLERATEQQREEVAAAIDELLATDEVDSGTVWRFGGYYKPDIDAKSMQRWLASVAERLRVGF